MQKQTKTKSFKIAYSKCQKGGLHKQQPMNSVCLNNACSQNMFICQICKSQQHQKHETQPFKYYLDQLQNSFQNNQTIQTQIKSLEERKNQLLATLQDTIINISNRFKELEKEILKRFQTARNKILEIDALKKGFEGIYNILLTPNHPDLNQTIHKYAVKVQHPTLPIIQRISTLETSIIQQINSAILFYADEKAKFSESQNLKTLFPTGVTFDGQTIQQIQGNKKNLCLLNEPITTQKYKIRLRIASENLKIVMGVISMAQFKKCQYAFDYLKISSNFAYWVSSQNKGSNYNSNTINSFSKQQVFDLSLKKNQLIINKRGTKQFASFSIKDLGVDWYFFVALLSPGKVAILNKQKK